ncbi:MAG: PHP domain-containing protein [Desulfobacterales bacterium]|jgi:predicted metal-dependent phosphoesterase TrpH
MEKDAMMGYHKLVMRYDFHIHTSQYSPCSRSTAESMCRRAIAVGLTGIALTEHDLWWPQSEVQTLQYRFSNLRIFQGIEYACAEGHFLVYLPDLEAGPALKANRILTLIKEVHAHNGIVIWAHPFRFDYTFTPGWLDAADLDGIEVASSNMGDPLKTLARATAEQKGIMQFINSDGHHEDVLGRYFNEIPTLLKNTQDFIDYVRGKIA